MPRGRFCLKLFDEAPSRNKSQNSNPMNLLSEPGGQRKKGDMPITGSNKTIEVVIKFKVWGNLRFLSHAETLKVFQRACARAGIKTAYSQGFNPRPKLSLPLPRSVGVESDDELLCLRLQGRQATDKQSTASEPPFDAERFKARLSGQLPDGFELLSVGVAKAKASFEPSAATYVLAVRREYLNEKLKSRIKHLLASESLNLQRRIDPKSSKFKIRNLKFKKVNVRPFLKSIQLNGRNIVVECKISSAGSIRIDEISELLELDVEKLAEPIRRTRVQWQLSS